MRGFSSAYSVQMLIVTAGHNSNNQSPCVVAAFYWTHENRQRVFHLKKNCVDAQHIKLRKYGPCRFSFQSVKQRPTGLFAIVISSWLSPHRKKWLWFSGYVQSKIPSFISAYMPTPGHELKWLGIPTIDDKETRDLKKLRHVFTCFLRFSSILTHACEHTDWLVMLCKWLLHTSSAEAAAS